MKKHKILLMTLYGLILIASVMALELAVKLVLEDQERYEKQSIDQRLNLIERRLDKKDIPKVDVVNSKVTIYCVNGEIAVENHGKRK